MNLNDAYGAFLDAVAQPVKYIPGRHYKVISHGKIVMARFIRVMPDEKCAIHIYGRGDVVGLLDTVYSLNDHIREPIKLLK